VQIAFIKKSGNIKKHKPNLAKVKQSIQNFIIIHQLGSIGTIRMERI